MDEQPSEGLRLVGAVLAGRYRLEQLLGEGGVGMVFRASVAGGGVVAVKLLHPEFRDHEEIVRRFFDESTIAARLQHPGVVKVFEAAEAEDGTPFLAMELLVGRPLNEALKLSGPLPLGFATPLLLTALDALGYAHDHGIIHRDLKPENLFVMAPPDGPPTLKIVDFGIAKVMDAAGGMGTRTRTGMLMGTPAYMSPEQLRDSKSVDPRTDLWSMAVILYELLSGHEPFLADNPMQQIHMVLGGETPPIATHLPALAPLQPFFDRGLSRDLSRRFPSAAAMAEALTAFSHALESGQPPPALPPLPTAAPALVAFPHDSSPEALAATVPPGSRPPPAPGFADAPTGSAMSGHFTDAPTAGPVPLASSPPPASFAAGAGAPPPYPTPLAPVDERVTSPGAGGSGRAVAVVILVVLALGLLVVAVVALVILLR